MTNVEGPDSSAAQPATVARPIRIFVGLSIAPCIAGELAVIARQLEDLHVRLIAPADIHLTLVPPWEVPAADDAIARLRSVAKDFKPFLLTVQRVCYGPQPRRPRLLWAECADSDELVALRAALLGAYGQSDARPYRPHVTLARLRDRAMTVVRAHPIDETLSLSQPVESVGLFQSPPPGEAGYKVLASAPLSGAPQ